MPGNVNDISGGTKMLQKADKRDDRDAAECYSGTVFAPASVCSAVTVKVPAVSRTLTNTFLKFHY